jgi:hypothetical protein
MADKIEFEIVVMMDADGDRAVGLDEDQAREMFESEVGTPTLPVRFVTLKTRMAPPSMEYGAIIDIPDAVGTIETEAA